MEYQYYEFQAIDRPLTKTERESVRSLSSRVKLTVSQAIFTYSYGDFRGDPLSVLGKYFDAMLYMANWGSHQLAFRFPKAALNLSALQPYCIDPIIEISTTAKNVILNIEIHEEEGGGWIPEENDWLSALMPLRQSILEGDYRVLYLAWLQAAAASGHLKENEQEPPIPPNLKKLNAPLQSFIEWLEIDRDVIAAAADSSPNQQESKEPLEDWIHALSDSEKTDILLEIVTGESAIANQIQARLRQKFAKASKPLSVSDHRRSYAELRDLATRQRSKRQAKEKAAAEAKRRQYLESLKPEQEKIWETIENLIARKQSNSYDQAIEHLVDLRDLAKLEGNSAAFQARILQLQTTYSNRPGLLRRIDKANLLN